MSEDNLSHKDQEQEGADSRFLHTIQDRAATIIGSLLTAVIIAAFSLAFTVSRMSSEIKQLVYRLDTVSENRYTSTDAVRDFKAIQNQIDANTRILDRLQQIQDRQR